MIWVKIHIEIGLNGTEPQSYVLNRFSIDLGISNSTGLVRKYVNIDGFSSGDSIDLIVFFFFSVFLKGLRVGLMINLFWLKN